MLPGSLFRPTRGHTCSSKPDNHIELPSEAVITSGKLSRQWHIQSQWSQHDSPRELLVDPKELLHRLGVSLATRGWVGGGRNHPQIRQFLMAENNSPQGGQL